MKFVYLVQTEGDTPEEFTALENRAESDESIDFIKLTFKKPCNGAIYFPNSSWTQGRNRLLRAAREKNVDYDYYVFCDDDLRIMSGSWELFEDDLREHRPALATPFNKKEPAPPAADPRRVYDIDAMANAVHRDLIEDGILFPYYEGFDAASWWLSQLFIIHMSGILYPGHVVSSSKLAVDNVRHRAYPRLDASPASWVPYEQFILKEIFGDHPVAHERFQHHYVVLGQFLGTPNPAKDSYRLTQAQRAMLNWDGAYLKERPLAQTAAPSEDAASSGAKSFWTSPMLGGITERLKAMLSAR